MPWTWTKFYTGRPQHEACKHSRQTGESGVRALKSPPGTPRETDMAMELQKKVEKDDLLTTADPQVLLFGLT
jgi:hypothetical protein